MAEGQDKRPKDAWDKLSVLSALLASVLVPISVAVVGNWYTAAIRDREVAISDRDQKIRQATFEREWVQLGLEILRDPDTAPNIRAWGVQIISRYAEVPMEEDVKTALTEGAVLPESTIMQFQAVPGVQQQLLAPLPSTTSRVQAMDQLQTRGVEALLDRDLEGALAAYDEAYALWPTFRNVDEVRRALIEASGLPGDPDWASLYGTIGAMDLRGVPPELRTRLTAGDGG